LKLAAYLFSLLLSEEWRNAAGISAASVSSGTVAGDTVLKVVESVDGAWLKDGTNVGPSIFTEEEAISGLSGEQNSSLSGFSPAVLSLSDYYSLSPFFEP